MKSSAVALLRGQLVPMTLLRAEYVEDGLGLLVSFDGGRVAKTEVESYPARFGRVSGR